MNRRKFMARVAATGAAIQSICRAATTDGNAQMPPVTSPRSTSGDPVEPHWDERITLTVGPKNADLVGSNEKVIQAAVDSIARWGGGTVKVLPGVYRFRNAVYLQNRVRILGAGEDSIIIKEPSVTARLVQDSDWFDQEITFADPKSLRIGDGICIRARDSSTGGMEVIKRTLVARSGARFKLDVALRKNVWLVGEPAVSSLFPLFSGENVADVTIENIALDGNKANNENLDGNYAGCIWMQDCNRLTFRRVIARNYNGDGLSWQVCHDVVAEDCHSHDHAGYGMHPGSGSQRSLIRGNRLTGNDLGLFFCWGVKWAMAEKNVIEGNRRFGVSIGHNDTDNVVRDNDIRSSGEVGVLFRDERNPAFQGNRNRIENNRIHGVTRETGVGIDVRGQTNLARIEANELRESQTAAGRIGIRIGAEARQITLVSNRIEGFSKDVLDLRMHS